MAHAFLTDAFGSLPGFLFSANWFGELRQGEGRDNQVMHAVERMANARTCRHACFANLADWAALRRTCKGLRKKMPMKGAV